MKILISNDDGVYAPGLRMLSQSLSQLGHVVVMAPDRNRSGASNSLTLDNPLRVKQLEPDIYAVEGTPTDCVHLALRGFLNFEPDLVVSGINAGANLGDDVMYSGTVAAAMEGRFLGLPAIAISLEHGEEELHYTTAAEITKNLIVQLQDQPLSTQTILNVNVPNVPYNEIKGISITRLGNRHRGNRIEHTTDPRGAPIYWIGPAGKTQDDGPGTDFYAIQHRFVSVTPLHLDLTHYKAMDSLTQWIIPFNERF